MAETLEFPDPSESAPAAPVERDALPARSAESTEQLLDALRESGPDRGCRTWWGGSQSSQTCAAVARHQLQEVMVHTHDARLALDAARPPPDEVALDGLDEFPSTCCSGTAAQPYQPAAVDHHATEGGSWRPLLSADGTWPLVLPTPPATTADASLRGTAAALVRPCTAVSRWTP
ncbi:maleylpyruvate isomerase N-terminal domain-containing protein [Streptomyces fagopyri]|uniref:maleylpyruvate isomerase N-terminal domain-containing protein n=1 Tax=Streptomyces fagopyri TaxID=2662397 RepID=UPI0036C79E47